MADLAIATDEPPKEHGFDYDRTVALSEAVFAIALTVLNIGVPGLRPRAS